MHVWEMIEPFMLMSPKGNHNIPVTTSVSFSKKGKIFFFLPLFLSDTLFETHRVKAR